LECLGMVGTIVPCKGLSASKAAEVKAMIVAKLVKALTDIIAINAKISGEQWNEGKMIAIPTSDFYAIFDASLAKANTPGERNAIDEILTNLTKAIQQ